MEDYLEKLNPQQRDAVLYTDGPQLVIAGAGSGKTRVLTYKIVHLLKNGYDAHRILALTFTNKAAREMRERILSLTDEQVAARLQMGTFHSVFTRILRINAERLGFRHDYTIYDAADSKSLIKLIVKDMGLDDKNYNPSALQSHISRMKNALVSPEEYRNNHEFTMADERANRPLTARIFATYCERCRLANAMDFDDLLFNTFVLLNDNEDLRQRYQEFFQYILVDEYQDTNYAQHAIIRILANKEKKLCVVGDDAQSIYSFRGANISNILSLQKSFPGLIIFKLEQNYRSTKTIIDAANSLIDKNRGQIRKQIFTDNETGGKIKVFRCYSDFEEAYVVASQIISLKRATGCNYNDIAVLYRTNAQSRRLEEALGSGGLQDKHGSKRRAIPYRIYGGLSFYQRKEVKDAVAYMRLSTNPHDDEALRRVINYPARGIGNTTMERVQHCAVEARVSMWEVINNPDQYGLQVNSGTRGKLSSFAELIQGFIDLNAQRLDAYQVASAIIERTRLLAVLQGDKTPENISKQENINELLSGLNDFVQTNQEAGSSNLHLSDYLAQISLMTDQDEESKNSGDCVTLMTIHAAKGLEFKNVIIVGLEEDLFPSSMSRDSHAALEEERRLMYVAMTRAEKNCVITYAQSRFRNGQTMFSNPSRFISDIDPQFLSIGKKGKDNDHYSAAPTIRQFQAPLHRQAAMPISRPSTPPPGFKPYSKDAPAAIVTPADGDYVLHSADELSEGCTIEHNRFGEGTVVRIDTTGDDAKIDVDFGEMGTRKLLLKYAKFKIL